MDPGARGTRKRAASTRNHSKWQPQFPESTCSRPDRITVEVLHSAVRHPGISFDSQGVCNFCHAHEKAAYLGVAALEPALTDAAGGNGRPRCIVPVSGGKDSTYVLYYLA